MSLLNDMLKDLDKGKSTAHASPLLTFNSKFALFQSLPNISPALLLPFACGAFCLIFFYFYYVLSAFNSEATKRGINLTSLVAPVPAVLPKQPVLKTAIQPEPEYISEIPAVLFPQPKPEEKKISMERPIDPQTIENEDISIHKVFSPLSDTEWHDEQLNRALIAIQDGHDEEAELLLSQILDKFPKAIIARETLANLYIAQERFEEARQTIQKGLQYAPNALTLNTIKARLAFEENHPQEALAILKQFKPNIQKNPDFYGLMAVILQSLGQENEAGNLYKVLVEIEPSNGQYWLGYGLSLEHNKSKLQAITAYKQASEHYGVEPAVRAYAENRLRTLQG